MREFSSATTDYDYGAGALALSADDIFQLETKARLHADRLRKDWPDDAAAPAVQTHARIMRDEAKVFDQIGDLLMGLRGCWTMGGAEMMRDGFKRESKAWDMTKTYVLAVEEKPAVDAVAEEVAA